MRTVDLFSGCGGMSLGAGLAGVNVVAAFDAWDAAVNVYQLNFDHPIHLFDLSNVAAAVKAIEHYRPELIIGGPPCQDFSHAGTRSEGERADLTKAFASIVRDVRPNWFVMENVDRASKSKAFQNARKILLGAGYSLTEQTLDASRCGVPQRRKRFFVIGSLQHEVEQLGINLVQGQSEKSVTVREYLGSEFGVTHYYRHPRNYSRRAVFSIDEPAPTVRGVNRPIPKGYPGHPSDSMRVGPTLRSLTTMERARLQTFPKSFQWEGTKTDLEQLIGNAVPVTLARYVFQHVLRFAKNAARSAARNVA